MARRSLSLSEDLAERYTAQTGPATRWGFLLSGRSTFRAPTRAELAPLQAAVTVTAKGLFGASAFALQTSRGLLTAEHVAPECGPVAGWGRWPGADHWHITRDGRTVFRSQSYPAVLRYFMRALHADRATLNRAA